MKCGGLVQRSSHKNYKSCRIVPHVSQLFSNYDSNTDQLFRVLNWNRLNHQHDIRKAIMMYKAVNNQTPDYLSSRFTPRLDVSNYNLKNVE